jgi:hypothetical protein
MFSDHPYHFHFQYERAFGLNPHLDEAAERDVMQWVKYLYEARFYQEALARLTARHLAAGMTQQQSEMRALMVLMIFSPTYITYFYALNQVDADELRRLEACAAAVLERVAAERRAAQERLRALEAMRLGLPPSKRRRF